MADVAAPDTMPLELSDEASEGYASSEEDGAAVTQLTPEMIAGLVKQIEFYFSDSNLPTDKKLLKQIRKDPDGYVPVKLFANFRKVRALSKDVSVITQALKHTSNLFLSDDLKRVRRIVPVPDYDIADIQRRTVVVENMPSNPSPTIESVTEMFRFYGRVKLVRICSKESKGKLPSWLTSSCQNMAAQHAYVEFEEEEGAILAAAALSFAGDSDEPLRGQLQVRRLIACIQEQRERRASRGTGGGSLSHGGSGTGNSRKGSRDGSPAPADNRRASAAGSNLRRTSGGGGSGSCGGSWTSSYGGAVEPYNGANHYHGSGGGAYDHYGSVQPLRRSGGGMPAPRPASLRGCSGQPQLQRRSDDSALQQDVAPPPPPPPRLNIYRPPAKRLSEEGASRASSFTSSHAAPRPSGGSFTSVSNCSYTTASAGGSIPASPIVSAGSASSTVNPFAPPPPPPPPPPQQPSPPAAAALGPLLVPGRASAPTIPGKQQQPMSPRTSAGGRPPTHPPPPPAQAQAPAPAAAPATAAQHTSLLAEAIAIAQQRSVSESGAAKAPARAAAPKFALDIGAASAPRRSLETGSAAAEPPAAQPKAKAPVAVVVPAAAVVAPVPAAAVPTQPFGRGQMVDDVEGFINNILARPTTRGTGPQAAALARRAEGSESGMVPPPVPTTAEDAAAAVANILAATVRKAKAPISIALMAPAAPAVPQLPPAAPAPTPAPAPAATPAPARATVFITALASSEEHIPALIKQMAVTEMSAKFMMSCAKAEEQTAAASAPGAATAAAQVVPANRTSPREGAASRRTSDGSHVVVHGPAVHVARGPDGSRGFGARKALAA